MSKIENQPISTEIRLLFLVVVLTFGVLFLFLPRELVLPLLVVALVAFLYFTIAILLARYRHRTPEWLNTAPLWLIVLIPVAIGSSFLFELWTDVTLTGAVFLLGMMFIFLYYWLIIPFAIVQKTEQDAWERNHEVEDYPDVTVLIPAYNEQGHISTTLDSLAEVRYPGEIELIVIDDGSTDDTYREVSDHIGTDALVIRKENGGKHSALNRGLEEATYDILVSIDADSWIDPDAITHLVEGFERKPGAGAIAGNVKVGNRESLVTNLQAVEYIIGINAFRRAFDHVGLVSVVPGCLGAFRRTTLTEIEGYSPDTLTEDFDLTIEILKRGESVHMSEGIVYTYAPTSWRGLYNQRLRWFRGNVQTLRKHADVFTNTSYGLLHRLVFPYAFLSMTLVPVLGVAVAVLIPLMVLAGQGWMLLQIGVFFLLLVVLLSLIAIELDEEDRWLTLLAPFSIIGYKQFLDAILLKSIVDVYSRKDLRWTYAGRRVAPGGEETTSEVGDVDGTTDPGEVPRTD